MTQRLEADRVPSRVAGAHQNAPAAEAAVQWFAPHVRKRHAVGLRVPDRGSPGLLLTGRAVRLLLGEMPVTGPVAVGVLGRRLIVQARPDGRFTCYVHPQRRTGSIGGIALRRQVVEAGFAPGTYAVRPEGPGRLVAERELTGAEAREVVVRDLRQELAP